MGTLDLLAPKNQGLKILVALGTVILKYGHAIASSMIDIERPLHALLVCPYKLSNPPGRTVCFAGGFPRKAYNGRTK